MPRQLTGGGIASEHDKGGRNRWDKGARGHKLTLDVSVDSIEPAREPARFVSFGRRVTNTRSQNFFRGFSKVFHGFSTTAFLGHSFEDLQQTPTLSRISLGRKNTFSFEVHVINQRVTSARRVHHAIELLPHLRSLGRGRFGEHFRKRLLQTYDEKLRLEINGPREELAQFFHPNRLACLIEFGAPESSAARCCSQIGRTARFSPAKRKNFGKLSSNGPRTPFGYQMK